MKKILISMCWPVMVMAAQAQTVASVPYTPSWAVRHHLQWLADHADLVLTGSHWPLPAAAVEEALGRLSPRAAQENSQVQVARNFVLKELAAAHSQGRIQLHLRSESDALNGYGENYTPGTSGYVSTAEGRGMVGDGAWGDVSMAGRFGIRLETSPNSLQTQFSGMGTEGKYQLRPDGSAAVLAWGGWNLQAFSRQNWWGPGWQSSLINGHNSPAWLGAGIQRGSVAPSNSAWLSWMGPWSLDVFVAKAQDPIVVQGQPSEFLFSGMRLTMRPKTWLEVGLSRGLQTGGAGRPGGTRNFVKAFFGQDGNQNPGDPVDSSGQIAGYDVRLTCPVAWGTCAVYTQWMGEDAAGQIPLPFKFMSLWGLDKTYGSGRYRVFAEWANSNVYSLPWDNKPGFPGFVNGVYSQGYTQGARWVGPAQGSGSRVLSLGWMDAEQQKQVKLHAGTVLTSIGAYSPALNAPHGRMWGVSASQTLRWIGMALTPELAYAHLADGQDQGANKRHNLRVGLTIAMPF